MVKKLMTNAVQNVQHRRRRTRIVLSPLLSNSPPMKIPVFLGQDWSRAA
jgi:hypothetical protein